MKVDRTSNRAWKNRRNFFIIMPTLHRLNNSDILKAVMETRPGLDREKVKKMIDDMWALHDQGA
jgi:hypothetical protein